MAGRSLIATARCGCGVWVDIRWATNRPIAMTKAVPPRTSPRVCLFIRFYLDRVMITLIADVALLKVGLQSAPECGGDRNEVSGCPNVSSLPGLVATNDLAAPGAKGGARDCGG